MAPLAISIRTISPIFVPLDLKTGTDRTSKAFELFEKNIHTAFDSALLGKTNQAQAEYKSIEQDSWQMRLFTWTDNIDAPTIKIHVFPNNIGIVEIDHTFEYTGDNKLIEQQAQDQAEQQVTAIYSTFIETINAICDPQYGNFLRTLNQHQDQAKIFWVSRTVILDSQDLAQPLCETLLTKWLAHTQRPQDAHDILTQQKDYSMTWLNYAIVDLKPNDDRLDSMILAQYYYSAQEQCNKLLKQAIDGAYNDAKNGQAQEKLSKTRVRTRMHQVDYNEHLNYLTRNKRNMLEDILGHWNYQQLTENGQRMIEICSSKIDETENIKRERSSLLTDLLLVALSFFTVFELSLYLTELSREMMSRPTLDFNDDGRSFMLQFIAEIDMDVMFGSGFFLTLLLVFIYKIIKSR